MRKPARLPADQLEPYLLCLPARADSTVAAVPIDWQMVFGNTNAVEIEVGCGKGLFLLNSAQARPEVNFAGIEIERKYQLFAATRMAKRGLRNVRLACADAREFLRDRVPSESVQTVHVYFPDPWWKKRHHKRRVFTAEFVQQCLRVLRPGGRLSVATDVGEYFQIIVGLVAEVPAFVAIPQTPPTDVGGSPDVGGSLGGSPRHDMDYLTNFERKAVKEGAPVYRAVFEKHGEPGA